MNLFLEKLIEIDKKLEGQAVLKSEFEDDNISVLCERNGHIVVSGSLSEHSEYSQSTTFCFQTDQTVLKPLIQDFSQLKQASLV